MDAPGAADRRALRGDIALWRQTGTDQPLRNAGVEASGHRILDIAPAGEGADLELGVDTVARRIARRDDADRLAGQQRMPTLERKHFRARTQHDTDPARAIVDPLRRLDRPRRDAKRFRD